MARKRTLFSEQIRQAIDDCGMTRYAIFKETGVSQATLSRFMNGHGSLSLDTLDKIAECIGLYVELEAPGKKRPRRKRTAKKGR